jgi:hypothetical protein
VATSEPVVLHHGREAVGYGHDEARPTASTACWAAVAAPFPGTESRGVDDVQPGRKPVDVWEETSRIVSAPVWIHNLDPDSV